MDDCDSRRLDKYTNSFARANIFVRDGEMYYQRGEGTIYSLQSMTDKDRYMVGEIDYFRLQFERDQSGEVTGLTGQYNSGRTDRHDRNDG